MKVHYPSSATLMDQSTQKVPSRWGPQMDVVRSKPSRCRVVAARPASPESASPEDGRAIDVVPLPQQPRRGCVHFSFPR